MDIVLICVGVLVAALGIFMLVTPYEKIASKMEGNPSKAEHPHPCRRDPRVRILLVVLQAFSMLIENGVI